MLNPFTPAARWCFVHRWNRSFSAGGPRLAGVSNAGQDWGVEDLAIEQLIAEGGRRSSRGSRSPKDWQDEQVGQNVDDMH
jgi:hypothetical protein